MLSADCEGVVGARGARTREALFVLVSLLFTYFHVFLTLMLHIKYRATSLSIEVGNV